MSEQSEAEISRRRALDLLNPALRELTANLLRITRGAGHPYRLPDQMAECLKAMIAYRAAVGYAPSTEEIQAALDPEEAKAEFLPWSVGSEEDQTRWEEDGSADRDRAIREIRRAGLQMTASMLVGQNTHIRRAEADMRNSIRDLEAAQEKRRASVQKLFPDRQPRGLPRKRKDPA